jgi:hypothetical protein
MCNPFNLVIADEDFHKGFNNVYDRALARALRTIFKRYTLCSPLKSTWHLHSFNEF